MKVLMCAYAVDNKDVGEAHLTWHWINNISKYVDVTLITMGSRINTTCGFEDHPNVKLCIVKPKITFRWTGAFDRVIKPDYVEFFFRAHKLAKQLVSQETFDVAHHIAPHSPRYPTPLYGLGLKLLVGPLHGGLQMPSIFQSTRKAHFLRRLVTFIDRIRQTYDPLMSAHFSSTNKLLVSAPYVKDALPPQVADRVVVIPPQPPEQLEVAPDRVESENLRLIFVGRLIESKGIRLALEALAKVSSSNIEFNIYGRGPLEDELREFVNNKNLNSVVNFHGFVTHDDVLKAYYSADVLLFPSLKEAWGLAVSEAMAAGLATICVDRGGPGYMIDEQCGKKIPIMEKDAMVSLIAEAIDELAASPEKTKAMGMAAQARIAREFTWNRLVEKLLSLYKS